MTSRVWEIVEKWNRRKKFPYSWPIAIGLIGVVLLAWGAAITSFFGKAILGTIGGICVGSAIVDGLFEREFKQNLKKNISSLQKNTQNLSEDIDALDKSVDALDKGVDALDSDISELQATVNVAKGATESGLIAVYATRKQCMSKIEKIIDEAYKGKKEGKVEVSILGISLADFLTHPGGLCRTFHKMLGSNAFEIKLAILSDSCKAAHCRGRIEEDSLYKKWDQKRKRCWNCEEGNEPCHKIYKSTTALKILETSKHFLQNLTHGQPIEPDGLMPNNIMKAKLKAYRYKMLPMNFMFRIDDEMFIEQYHLSSAGGQTPVLHIKRYRNNNKAEESVLFQTFKKHFDSILVMSKQI